MKGLNRQRFPLIAGLLLAVLSLSFYGEYLWSQWAPIVRRQGLTAPRLTTPIARDFPLHWTASYLALTGRAASVYDYPSFKASEQALTGISGHPWPYPPTALLIDLPLARLPYFLSLAAWLAVTLGLYLLVLYRTAPHLLTMVWGLAFFGTFQNFYFGQNGFLSAALLGGGLLLLERFPLTGGAVLGLVSYKPHLAALVPLALLAGRRWRALAGTVVSAVGLALASLWVFPADIWVLFLKSMPNTMNDLYGQHEWFFKMPTVYAATRLAGYQVSVAWGVHGPAMLGAGILVVWLWAGKFSPAVRAAGLILGILLFSPHIWFYDLPLLAVALAWLWWEGHTGGWLPLEQTLLLYSWFMPIVSFFLSVWFKWSTGPLYLIFPLILLIRRCYWERQQGPARRTVTPPA
jgi:hypothetical protein